VSKENLVLALNALDEHLRHPISKFSHLAAVTADRADYAAAAAKSRRGRSIKEVAEERHAHRVQEALEEMVAPDPAHELRRRLVEAVLVAGVRLSQPGCLGCAKHSAMLIRSRRSFKSVATRNPAQGVINRPHAEQVDTQLADYGL
jgi:hypothetical protein